jgi:hypothetical protein
MMHLRSNSQPMSLNSGLQSESPYWLFHSLQGNIPPCAVIPCTLTSSSLCWVLWESCDHHLGLNLQVHMITASKCITLMHLGHGRKCQPQVWKHHARSTICLEASGSTSNHPGSVNQNPGSTNQQPGSTGKWPGNTSHYGWATVEKQPGLLICCWCTCMSKSTTSGTTVSYTHRFKVCSHLSIVVSILLYINIATHLQSTCGLDAEGSWVESNVHLKIQIKWTYWCTWRTVLSELECLEWVNLNIQLGGHNCVNM